VIRDEQIQDIAAHAPRDQTTLARTRGLGADFARGRLGEGVLSAVERALGQPKEAWPQPSQKRDIPPGLGPLIDLLKVLLKTKCEQHGVAQKLVATSQELEQIAADDKAKVAALQGWRYEVFGADALRLKHGKLALAAEGRQVKLIEV